MGNRRQCCYIKPLLVAGTLRLNEQAKHVHRGRIGSGVFFVLPSRHFHLFASQRPDLGMPLSNLPRAPLGPSLSIAICGAGIGGLAAAVRRLISPDLSVSTDSILCFHRSPVARGVSSMLPSTNPRRKSQRLGPGYRYAHPQPRPETLPRPPRLRRQNPD
jgi:hypothetical protein